MIFLATDSSSGRPVWVHVIAEPVDAGRAELVRRAKVYIQAGGGQDLEEFLEYGYHDKTHYVITASRPECKELGPYLDTLLALRGIEVPNKPANSEATASGTIANDRTQEITARLRRAGDSTASRSQHEGEGASAIRHSEPPRQDRTMSSQPTMFLRPEDVRQPVESGASHEQAAASAAAPAGERPRIVDSPDETETTIRFVRPQFASSGSEAAFDPDQTAKVVSPWAAKRVEARQRGERPASKSVPSPPVDRSGTGEYPERREMTRPSGADASYTRNSVAGAAAGRQAQAPMEHTPHQNGSGGHRLVLPPVRRKSRQTAGSSPTSAGFSEPAASRTGSPDPRLLYMTLALVMVSLAAIALGLGWYIHSTASVGAPPAAVAPAVAAGGAQAPAAAQPNAASAPAQAVPQQQAGAPFSPLLLSIAFISAVLIFAAVVVLFMAVKKGS